MKVGIIIITFNISTRVFILQMEAIKKLCKDDYVVEIIDNSSDEEMSEAIKHHAGVQEVLYRRVISDTKDPSLSHSFAANYAYSKVKDTYEAVLFLDHDIFPTNYFSVKKMLNNKIVGGLLSGHDLSYFWPGLLCIDNTRVEKELVDFSPNNELRLDTGGQLRLLKDKYEDEGCEYFDEVGVQNPFHLTHKYYYFYMMIYKNVFLHCINASNWRGLEDNEQRISSLLAIASEKIKANEKL